MHKYSREIVAEVLAANDIVDIVGAAVELKSAGGGRLKGLCPFHREKTPSFHVSRDRQTFHCFGCNKGGDALSFIVEHQGLTFMEALRALADRGGVKLPAMSPAAAGEDHLRTQLQELGKAACAYFREHLAHPMRGSLGRQYLKKRSLADRTVQRFGLGFVPEGWSNLLDAMRQKGFKDDVLRASGLFKDGDNARPYDFFRNRLMIPIRDVAGHVVAFGGRDLGDSQAKYINSPETLVYKKSKVLYGLHEAREALRKEKRAILVEGYFDLMRCFDAGIENVVASCGTALTSEQAALIRRYVPEAVIVYDGDAAGITAALKATGVLMAAGLSVRAMALPDNQDPDDFIRDKGADAFRALVAEASDAVTFYVKMNPDRAATIEGRTQIAQEVFAILQHIDDTLRLDEYLKRLAKELGLLEYSVRTEYARFLRELVRPAPAESVEKAPLPALNLDDCHFIAALLADPALRQSAREALAGVVLGEGPLAEVLNGLLPLDGAEGDPYFDGDEARRLYAAATTCEIAGVDLPALAAKRIHRLQREALRARAAQVQIQIQEAERVRDTVKLADLLVAKVTLERQLRQVGAA